MPTRIQEIADALIPHALKAVAGLYRLFWFATRYSFSIDNFRIIKNGFLFFEDTFSDGQTPPSAPNFPNGNPVSYFVSGTLGPESNGKLTIDSSGAIVVPAIEGGNDFLLQQARLQSNIDPTNLIFGLKIDDTFSVTGTFDLILPGNIDEAYGILLTDQTTTSAGNDLVDLMVRRRPDGVLQVIFQRRDLIAGTATFIASVPLDPSHDQIALTLTRPSTASNAVQASFAYIDGGVVGAQTTFAPTTTIFNGENFTRAAFRARSRLP